MDCEPGSLGAEMSNIQPADLRGRIAHALPFITLAVIVTFIAAGWPKYWQYINFEQAPMTQYQAALLLCAAVIAAINAMHCRRLQERREVIVWGFISLVFLYLALDEQFTIHETVRETLLKPYGKIPFLPWVGPGDYLPLLYATVAIAGLPFFWPFIVRNTATRWRLVMAALLAGTAIVLDSINWHEIPGNWLGREQFLEECMEAMAYSLFAASFLTAADHRDRI